MKKVQEFCAHNFFPWSMYQCCECMIFEAYVYFLKCLQYYAIGMQSGGLGDVWSTGHSEMRIGMIKSTKSSTSTLNSHFSGGNPSH